MGIQKSKFLVIGLGKFGTALVRELHTLGAEVIAVDKDMEVVEPIKEDVEYAVRLDSTDKEALRSVGAQEVDGAIIAIGRDLEANILTVAVLKELGVEKILARCNTAREEKILRLVGATKVVYVEHELGHRLARKLVAPGVLEHVELAPGYSMVQLEADRRFQGKTLVECAFRSEHGVNVVGIRHKEEGHDGKFRETLDPVPRPEYTFDKGDVLVVVGADENIERLAQPA